MSGTNAIMLVARREIRERLRSQAFLWSTLIMLIILAGSSALPTMLATEPTYRVAVAVPAPPGLEVALQRAAEPFEANVDVQVVGPPLPVATRSPRRTWTRSCSSTRTGSSSVRASTRSSRQPQTLRCERSAAICRRRRS